jgi:hypothetical protein
MQHTAGRRFVLVSSRSLLVLMVCYMLYINMVVDSIKEQCHVALQVDLVALQRAQGMMEGEMSRLQDQITVSHSMC